MTGNKENSNSQNLDNATYLTAIQRIVVKSPVGEAYEDLKDQASFSWITQSHYRLFSRHNRDLYILLFAFLILFILIIAASIVYASLNSVTAVQILLGGTIIGAFITVMTKIFEVAQKRLSMADLMIGEITSIARVFISLNIIPSFIQIFKILDAIGGEQLSEFADVSRKENYFAVYEKNCRDLGLLAPGIVEDISAFYVFLKASRDATGSLILWKNPSYLDVLKKNDLIGIMYSCFLMAIHGRRAMERLIENYAQREYVTALFKTMELQSFLLLSVALDPNDVRRGPLDLRSKRYAKMLEELGLDLKIRHI